MDIEKLIRSVEKPGLYERGNAVMWTDPHISKQLLELHLDPRHDMASRGKSKIMQVADWMLTVSNSPHQKILDLGCGPGLYAQYLAGKGHEVTGVDISRNSIEYARQQASNHQLDIDYRVLNYLDLDLDSRFDLVIMIYLDFCVLLPGERDKVLQNILKALKPGGILIFDVINERNIDQKITKPAWEKRNKGFWRDGPYLALENGYHYPDQEVFVSQHVVVSEEDIRTYLFWNHYYTLEKMLTLMTSEGFSDVINHENLLPGKDDPWQGENITFYSARKPG